MKPAALPPIEDLLPHRGTMLLLDRVTEFGPESACAEYQPRNDAWYADSDGNMPAWIGIELMAQTIAAHVGLVKRAASLPQKQGVLLGTRRYVAKRPAFMTGQTLTIVSRVLLTNEGGLGAYDCLIRSRGETVAEATLKVYEPDDFQSFLEASQS